jgi:uncharacterized phage-associated protein
MATVYDVAAYILSKKGVMTAMKLEKLTYYSQAWSLVWNEACLFHNRFEAWANGPVSPELYAAHAGMFEVGPGSIIRGNPAALSERESRTVDTVLDFYGEKTAQWLSDLTHLESPWKDARNGLPPGARSSAEITPAAMAEYYGGLGPKS